MIENVALRNLDLLSPVADLDPAGHALERDERRLHLKVRAHGLVRERRDVVGGVDIDITGDGGRGRFDRVDAAGGNSATGGQGRSGTDPGEPQMPRSTHLNDDFSVSVV